MRGGHAGPRGVRGGRGGGGLGAGLPNAPRGPSHMRRGHDTSRSHRDREREREVNDRKRREKSKDAGQKEDKTTLTDFRIVGIEVKSLGWSWGQIGHEVEEDEEEEVDGVEDDPVVPPEPSVKEESKDEAKPEESVKEETNNDSVKAPEPLGEGKEEQKETDSAVKGEPVETIENVEEKRGEKRKAKTPEAGTLADSQDVSHSHDRRGSIPQEAFRFPPFDSWQTQRDDSCFCYCHS